MDILRNKNIISVFFIMFLFFTVWPLHGQEVKKETSISGLMSSGKYRDALTLISRKLDEIYSNRVEEKRIPTEFISLKNTTDDIDLNKLFRDRQEKGFFIEDNPEISVLHRQAGECYLNIKDSTRAINHLVQSLRFKNIEPYKDDVIYYMMARAFLNSGKITAYHRFLESAFTLNPENYQYSEELGKALARTVKKRKSLFAVDAERAIVLK